MSLIEKIRSVLGLSESDSGEGTNVSVEHEPADDAGEPGDGIRTDRGDGPEGLTDPEEQTGVDATVSTDSETGDSSDLFDEPAEQTATAGETTVPETDDEMGEPAETDEETIEPKEGSDEAIESTAETDETVEPEEGSDEESGAMADDEPAEPGIRTQPVDTISGIGPAYARRLEEAGVETVADLLAADAADLAERTDLSEKRIGRWQTRGEEA